MRARWMALALAAAGCSSTGGGGSQVDPDFRDHVPAAVEHARQAVAQVEGLLPAVVHPALTEVPGVPCSGYWCAAHPEGYPARGWCDIERRHLYIAGPPDGAWTPAALARAYDVTTHEALHLYVPWHDPRYDRFAPFWREAREITGRRGAGPAEFVCGVVDVEIDPGLVLGLPEFYEMHEVTTNFPPPEMVNPWFHPGPFEGRAWLSTAMGPPEANEVVEWVPAPETWLLYWTTEDEVHIQQEVLDDVPSTKP